MKKLISIITLACASILITGCLGKTDLEDAKSGMSLFGFVCAD